MFQPYVPPQPKKIEIPFNASPEVFALTAARCELIQLIPDGETIEMPLMGLVEFNQEPLKPIEVRAMISNMSDETEYQLRIGDYGNINGNECDMTGDVFNPLNDEIAKIYGQYAAQGMMDNEGRGEIPTFESNVDGRAHFSGVELLQNLAGDGSIIGRSITLLEKDDTTPIACCVVGISNEYMLLPEKEVAEAEVEVEDGIVTFDD